MTVVQQTLVVPGGEPAAFAIVTVTLAGPDGAAFESDDETLVYREKLRVDEDGFWTINLTPNDEIVPSGTVWRRTVTAPRSKRVVADDYFLVPKTNGPYELQDLLVDPPDSIEPTALAAHVASRGPGSHLPDGPGDDGDVPILTGGVVEWGPQSGGGGSVTGVGEGTGIDVDSTNPAVPVVALDAASQAALGEAVTAVQPADLAGYIPQGGPLTADLDSDGFSLVDSLTTGATEIGPTRTLYYGDDHPGFIVSSSSDTALAPTAKVEGATTYMLPGPTSTTTVAMRANDVSGAGGRVFATHQDAGGFVLGAAELGADALEGTASMSAAAGATGMQVRMAVLLPGPVITGVAATPGEFVVTMDDDTIPERAGSMLVGQGGAVGLARAAWIGTQAEFDLLTEDPQTLYIITEDP